MRGATRNSRLARAAVSLLLRQYTLNPSTLAPNPPATPHPILPLLAAPQDAGQDLPRAQRRLPPQGLPGGRGPLTRGGGRVGLHQAIPANKGWALNFAPSPCLPKVRLTPATLGPGATTGAGGEAAAEARGGTRQLSMVVRVPRGVTRNTPKTTAPLPGRWKASSIACPACAPDFPSHSLAIFTACCPPPQAPCPTSSSLVTLPSPSASPPASASSAARACGPTARPRGCRTATTPSTCWQWARSPSVRGGGQASDGSVLY
jgi:hypothetical protein